MSPTVPPRPRSSRRLLMLIAVLLFVMPLIEITAVIAVGQLIGVWPTITLLVLESALGAWIVRREGGRAWEALVTALQTGRMPSRELSDAALILVGGVLLLTPGFVTDLVGFVVVLPMTRPVARRLLERVVAQRLLGGIVPQADPATWRGPGEPHGSTGAGDTIRGDVID
ncbi:FxsA family protein [Nostocoides sp. F2B08]|uniref:FxsA family protein n=1 Tax=Nostocoides sp. F2B08 TaxID=2653936 RepID=UPI0012637AA6|nr:FxsA family protein [Tetrasphaera sp. F2B08]KAB7742990.1 FxsA family protein [Tetrasphaera sp. F2B08]